MGKQYSSDLKLKAVKYYNKIKNYVQTCEIFECSERSLKRWVERYNNTGDIIRKDREGSYKLRKKHIKYIKELIKNNNDIRMKDLHLRFIQKFKDIDISRQYLSKILRDNNITRKRATFEHFPTTYRGQPRNEKEELKAFFKKISKFSLDNIISIDETSVSTSLSVNYCRNDLGKRCIIKTDDNSVFKKYSLVVAITNKKCIGYKLYDEGAVNSDRFNDFISIICNNVKNKLIVLDNGQIHKKDSTKNIINSSKNHIVYTVPYHPRLNCIEQWFSQVKHYMKLDKSTNLNTLKESLKSSIKKIKEEHYKNYFIYAYNKNYYKNKEYINVSNKHREPKIYKD